MMRNLVVLIVWGCIIGRSFGIRFSIDTEECFSHKAENGDTVHYSFVVISVEGSYHSDEQGVDFEVHGPTGQKVHEYHNKISENAVFVVRQAGVYQFCFTNQSPYHETIDFDVHAGQFSYHAAHAKDEHFRPLYDHVGKLQEALYSIQFEQHWIEALTDRQALANEGMSKRTMHKALIESAALISASVLQVFLLRRLFDKHAGKPRV